MLTFGNRQPNQKLGFGGIDLSFGMGQPQAPAPVVFPGSTPQMQFAPSGSAPVTAADIASFSDPMSSALAGAGATGVVDISAGAAPGMVAPAADDPTGQGWLKSTFMNEGGGLNMQSILGGISAFGGLWGASKQLGLAKDSLNFQKEIFRTNTENQRKSYNTALEDRARSRYAQEGAGQSAADDYVRRNRL